MDKKIKQSIEILRNGGIVIFPTDTVYVIGCRLDYESSLERLFKIRKRPLEKAVLAVVSDIQMAEKYVKVDKEVKSKFIDKYWPGSLTIILPCFENKVPHIARSGGTTLAVRQTNHKVLLKLINGVGVPLVAPSANFAGDPTPQRFSDINKNLIDLSDFAINLPSGGQRPSTIIDCSKKPWKIIRQGDIEVKW